MYGYIYKTTNLLNGKIYIGQHKSDLFDTDYYGSGKYFRRALKKYGKDNFSVEILEWCDSKELADEREVYYIQKSNSRNPSIGYNIAYGGEGGDLVTCLPEDERKRFSDMVSEFNRLGITGNKCNHLSEEHKRKISESNTGKKMSAHAVEAHRLKVKGLPAWNKGLTADDPRVAKYVRKKGEFHHTDDTRKRISEHTKGVKKPKVSEKMRGRKWMHNNNHTVMVFEHEIEQYKAQGYLEGRGKIR